MAGPSWGRDGVQPPAIKGPSDDSPSLSDAAAVVRSGDVNARQIRSLVLCSWFTRERERKRGWVCIIYLAVCMES